MDRKKTLLTLLILLSLASFALTFKIGSSNGVSGQDLFETLILPSASGLLFFLLSLTAFLFLPPRPGLGPLLAFEFLVGEFFILFPTLSFSGPLSFFTLLFLSFTPATMIHFTFRYSEMLIEWKRSLIFYILPYGLSLLISIPFLYFSLNFSSHWLPVSEILMVSLVSASLFWVLRLVVFLRKPHPELHRIVSLSLLWGQLLGILIPSLLGIGIILEKISLPFPWLSPLILLFPLSLLIGIIPRKRELSQAYVVLSEKRTTSGNLLAGLAHEINNPMTFIYSSLEPLRESIQKLKESFIQNPDEVPELSREIDQLINNMEEGARRAKTLIEKFRFFPYPGQEEMKEVDLNRIISQSITLLSYKWKGRIRIEERLEPIPNIRCFPGEIGQVFTNLIANACEAIETQGVIQVATHRGADGIKIRIRDSGKGISKNEILRIYDPFFTTKAPGEGTGLGLAITLQIIKNHKGKIEVKSEVGKGTEFLILLPVEEKR